MKRIVVSDTNIFIDLIKLGRLNDFFALPWEIHTTDFVMAEIRNHDDKEDVLRYYKNGKLTIKSFSAEQMFDLYAFMDSHSHRLSIADCSVCLYAESGSFIVLSGDQALCTNAKKDGIETHGILHVFDKMLEFGIISKELAIDCLELLKSINKWLPADEIDSRLSQWKKTLL